jgi:hypothetical protein
MWWPVLADLVDGPGSATGVGAPTMSDRTRLRAEGRKADWRVMERWDARSCPSTSAPLYRTASAQGPFASLTVPGPPVPVFLQERGTEAEQQRVAPARPHH